MSLSVTVAYDPSARYAGHLPIAQSAMGRNDS